MLISVDPGPTQSAFVELNGGRPIKWGKIDNKAMLEYLHADRGQTDVVLEMIASYGMAVGMEVFETCVMIGRFWQTSVVPVHRLTRHEIKIHLCKSAKANDSNIRQALMDRFGPGKEMAIGVKAKQGPLYGMSRDCWAALAVGVTWADRHGGSSP